ncbi:MAG TPA: hypothetical protein VL947_10130 [Cytophagales bacterium]|nr:hypothetical protein [Cytophagales bacterium]
MNQKIISNTHTSDVCTQIRRKHKYGESITVRNRKYSFLERFYFVFFFWIYPILQCFKYGLTSRSMLYTAILLAFCCYLYFVHLKDDDKTPEQIPLMVNNNGLFLNERRIDWKRIVSTSIEIRKHQVAWYKSTKRKYLIIKTYLHVYELDITHLDKTPKKIAYAIECHKIYMDPCRPYKSLG